ncbi:MAG: YdeI/OmpD-associated family protein, partial [Gemmatimonadaceae bacterium]|nr:YdeI/OmpD-associated family protein [Gemmatimonadaceae bacterium]
MGTRDPRVDAYIEKSGDFAKPILRHLRDVVHDACPDVQETIKWSAPHFDYHGIMCAMAAFKAHCSFGFWKASLIEGLGPNSNNGGAAAGNFGRITTLKELPSARTLAGFVKKAARLNEEGVPVAKKKAVVARPEAVVPDVLAKALAKNRKARATFDAFSPSHRREYIEWITEAKREETRTKRVDQAIAWLAEGKARHWKHG